jgi:hypothetical protein
MTRIEKLLLLLELLNTHNLLVTQSRSDSETEAALRLRIVKKLKELAAELGFSVAPGQSLVVIHNKVLDLLDEIRRQEAEPDASWSEPETRRVECSCGSPGCSYEKDL